MLANTPDPDQEPAPPQNAFEHLERVHRDMQEEQAAWRKLLESLAELKRKPEPPRTETSTK